MIELEILESPDINILGHYKSYQNPLTVGYEKSHIMVRHQSFIPHSFEFIFKPKLYLIKKNEQPFHLNGKICFHQVSLNINDQIKIGGLVFILKNYSPPESIDKKKIMQENFELIQNDPQYDHVKQILGMLKNDLNDLSS